MAGCKELQEDMRGYRNGKEEQMKFNINTAIHTEKCQSSWQMMGPKLSIPNSASILTTLYLKKDTGELEAA